MFDTIKILNVLTWRMCKSIIHLYMGWLGIELKNLVSVYEKVTLFCRSKHNNFLFKHDESLERFRLVA